MRLTVLINKYCQVLTTLLKQSEKALMEKICTKLYMIFGTGVSEETSTMPRKCFYTVPCTDSCA